MDFNLAHFNMVQQQVRPWDVLEPQILETLARVPREKFVLAAYKQLSYAEAFIPLGNAQVMLTPTIVGRILQALAIDKEELVLEVGTGTGYLTALISLLAKKVVSIEILSDLFIQAQHILKSSDLASEVMGNIVLDLGDAALGWEAYAPYDVIVITGSLPFLPLSFRDQVSLHGRIFAIVGEPPLMKAMLYTRVNRDLFEEIALFETCVPPLMNAPQPNHFRF